MPSPLSQELLGCIPAFLAAAEERSATRAARRLGMTAATVLRRIDALETGLGVRLFNRLPSGLEPTEAFTRVRPWAEQAVGALTGMQREVSGLEEKVQGVVRVAVPTAVATTFFVPRVQAFRERYPDVVIEFASAVAVVDLPQRQADIALRTARPSEAVLVARKLGSFRYVPACSPALLDGRSEARLDHLPWVQWDSRTQEIAEARWLAEHIPDAKIAMRASDMPTIVGAAQRGVGAIVVAESLALAVGGLVRLETDLPLWEGATWLVAHRAIRHVPRVDAVWRWIEEAARDLDAR